MMTPTADRRAAGRPLRMAAYAALFVAGTIWPWYFNLKHIAGLDGPFNLLDFFGQGFVNPAGSSLTIDHLIVAATVLAWMAIEGRRLGMRPLWPFLGWSILVAISSGLPLFLLVRERVLAGTCGLRAEPAGGVPPDARPLTTSLSEA